MDANNLKRLYQNGVVPFALGISLPTFTYQDFPKLTLPLVLVPFWDFSQR